jgi:hypothetical protein
MFGAIFAACVLAAAGALVALIGRRGRQGRLPRQHWAGIRTPSTMRSDDAWLAAHRAGGPPMEVAGWFAVALGALAVILAPTGLIGPEALPVLAAGVLLVGVTIGGVLGVRAARHLS